MRVVAGDIFIPGMVDRVRRNVIRTAAGVGLGTGSGDADGEVAGETVNQDVGRPRKRDAVVEFAGALGNAGNRVEPGPVSAAVRSETRALTEADASAASEFLLPVILTI